MRQIGARLVVSNVVVLATAGIVGAWSTPSAVVSTSQDSLDPRMTVDSNGRCHVVWRERTGGTIFRIWYTNNTTGPFADPVEISQAGSAQSYSPAIAADGTDLHAAWICDPDGTNFEIWYRRKTAGGWGTIFNASNTSIKSLRPAIAARNSVGPVVAWDEAVYADDNYDTFFADWNGSGFNAAINISNTPGGTVYGSVNVNIAVAPNGDVTAVWAESITGDYHVNARRCVDGVWQPRQELSTLKTGPATPGIAVSGDNRVHVVYEAEGAIWYQIWNGSTWAAPAGLPGGLNSGIRPRIAIDSEGSAHVVADAYADNRDIFYCTNAGGSWSAWLNISNTAGTHSFNADIGYAAGLITVTWQEPGDGTGGTGVFNTWYATQPTPPLTPTGTIAGTVRDNFGNGVPGASVWAAGYYYVAITAADGAYTIPSVPVGTYSVTAAKVWYSSQSVPGVEVTAGAAAGVDFTLQATPPDPVVSLTATPGNTANTLEWTNPTTGNFAGTMLRFSTSAHPATPADGTLVIDKPAAPGSADTFQHTGLTNGLTYYYTAFAHTDALVYAGGVNASAKPFGPADHDRDGDVDQSDFGHFQACYSGAFVPQNDPNCRDAMLEGGDDDVDAQDFAVFMQCLAGPGVAADPLCASP